MRDAVRSAIEQWYGYLEIQVRTAAGDGSLDQDDEGIEQLAFALPALYEQANARSLLYGSDRPYALAARGMRDLLLQAGADASTLSALPV